MKKLAVKQPGCMEEYLRKFSPVPIAGQMQQLLLGNGDI